MEIARSQLLSSLSQFEEAVSLDGRLTEIGSDTPAI
jgi:hypothetical protein